MTSAVIATIAWWNTVAVAGWCPGNRTWLARHPLARALRPVRTL